jgi:hypothetical protein
MNLQISPFGVIIASPFYLLAYLLLLRFWRKLRASPMRWGILALTPIVLALPFADEFWIAWRFREACKDAGVHVYRQVTVEGFVDDTNRGSRHQVVVGLLPNFDPKSLQDWDRRGYRFQENMLDDGGVLRLERTEQGIVASVLDRPSARYRYKRGYDVTPYSLEESASYAIEKVEYQVVDSESGELLGRDTRFTRFPCWIERIWIRYLGSGGNSCPDRTTGTAITQHLPQAALVPAAIR